MVCQQGKRSMLPILSNVGKVGGATEDGTYNYLFLAVPNRGSCVNRAEHGHRRNGKTHPVEVCPTVSLRNVGDNKCQVGRRRGRGARDS